MLASRSGEEVKKKNTTGYEVLAEAKNEFPPEVVFRVIDLATKKRIVSIKDAKEFVELVAASQCCLNEDDNDIVSNDSWNKTKTWVLKMNHLLEKPVFKVFSEENDDNNVGRTELLCLKQGSSSFTILMTYQFAPVRTGDPPQQIIKETKRKEMAIQCDLQPIETTISSDISCASSTKTTASTTTTTTPLPIPKGTIDQLLPFFTESEFVHSRVSKFYNVSAPPATAVDGCSFVVTGKASRDVGGTFVVCFGSERRKSSSQTMMMKLGENDWYCIGVYMSCSVVQEANNSRLYCARLYKAGFFDGLSTSAKLELFTRLTVPKRSKWKIRTGGPEEVEFHRQIWQNATIDLLEW